MTKYDEIIVPTTQNGKSASKSNAGWTCVDWISWISRFKTSIAFGKPSILRFKQPKQNAFKPIPVTVPVDRWFWSQVRFLFLFVFLFTPGATANKRKQWNLRCLTILAAMDPNRVPGKWASQCCKSLVASKSVDCFWNISYYVYFISMSNHPEVDRLEYVFLDFLHGHSHFVKDMWNIPYPIYSRMTISYIYISMIPSP